MATPIITHRKVSGKPAGPDPSRVYGTHWDDSHVVTGLENIDNTSDVNKPVSTAQAAADAVVAANAANASNLTSGTVAAARMPALTGDVTTSAGAVATTLATVNSNVGSFGSATQASQVTVNAKGLVTAAANVTVTPAVGSITGLGTGVATALAVNVGTAGSPVVNGGALGTPSAGVGTNLSGIPTTALTGTLQAAQEPAHTGDVTNTAGSLALTLATVNSNVGTWGSTTAIPIITLNGKGLATAASTATIREVLTATRDYFVRTDGSDSNTGLANTAGGAFLTVAKALSVASMIDCSAFQLTINVQAGTYTPAVSLPRMVGGVLPILTGVGSTTIISTTSAAAISNDGGTPWQVNNMKLATTSSGPGLFTKNGGVIKFSGIEFGAIAEYGMQASPFSSINATGNYSISGAAQYHIISNGSVDVSNRTVTITGTPAFSGAFVLANRTGTVIAFGMTFSGSATGTRYSATGNGVIDTAGGGATVFPGNVAGSTATGGQYL